MIRFPTDYLFSMRTGPKIVSEMTRSDLVYHNISHALELAQIAYNTIDLSEDDMHFYYLSAFYHDIVYHPSRSDNELQSAEMFARDVRVLQYDLRLSPETLSDITNAILLTKDHFDSQAYGDQLQWRVQRFLDLDLLILAADNADYDRYVGKVRLEYSSVSDEDWRTGRIKFLCKVLNVPRIFRTMKARYDINARANMERELRNLDNVEVTTEDN